MTTSSPAPAAKSFGMKRIPLTGELADEFVAWMKEKYLRSHPQNVNECRDPVQLAFFAGQISMVHEIEAIIRDHRNKQ
jgi:hypothetical protein